MDVAENFVKIDYGNFEEDLQVREDKVRVRIIEMFPKKLAESTTLYNTPLENQEMKKILAEEKTESEESSSIDSQTTIIFNPFHSPKSSDDAIDDVSPESPQRRFVSEDEVKFLVHSPVDKDNHFFLTENINLKEHKGTHLESLPKNTTPNSGFSAAINNLLPNVFKDKEDTFDKLEQPVTIKEASVLNPIPEENSISAEEPNSCVEIVSITPEESPRDEKDSDRGSNSNFFSSINLCQHAQILVYLGGFIMAIMICIIIFFLLFLNKKKNSL